MSICGSWKESRWDRSTLSESDALIAFLQIDLCEVVRAHQLQQILDRADIKRPRFILFLISHRLTPKAKPPVSTAGREE